MTRRLIYVSGEPGIGKSTLMGHITAGWSRYPQPAERDAPARDLLHARAFSGTVAVELGRQRDSFSGTDALPSSVIRAACMYVSAAAHGEADLLLAEGARLANRRFLTSAIAADWQVTLIHMYGQSIAAHRRRMRAAQLGRREQAESWVTGRRTAARNLANAAPDWGVDVHPLNVEAVDYLAREAALVARLRGEIGFVARLRGEVGFDAARPHAHTRADR